MGTTLRYCTKINFWVGDKAALSSGRGLSTVLLGSALNHLVSAHNDFGRAHNIIQELKVCCYLLAFRDQHLPPEKSHMPGRHSLSISIERKNSRPTEVQFLVPQAPARPQPSLGSPKLAQAQSFMTLSCIQRLKCYEWWVTRRLDAPRPSSRQSKNWNTNNIQVPARQINTARYTVVIFVNNPAHVVQRKPDQAARRHCREVRAGPSTQSVYQD